jgi:hypothetical protein
MSFQVPGSKKTEVDMKFYHAAPEKELHKIYNDGIHANERGEIPLIVLADEFMLKKFIFDLYAHEILGVEVYCLFEINPQGIAGPLSNANIDNIFSRLFKVSHQPHITRKDILPYQTEENYQGMGLIEGMFPVENKDKFTEEYKQKVLEYLNQVTG